MKASVLRVAQNAQPGNGYQVAQNAQLIKQR